MRKIGFDLHKWFARTVVGIGALIGLSACSNCSGGSISSAECVYGPPPEVEKEVEMVEDVYGPPVAGDSAVNNVEADHKTDRVL